MQPNTQQAIETITFLDKALSIATTANAELRAEIAQLKANIQKLRGFASYVLDGNVGVDFNDLDHDALRRFGLINRRAERTKLLTGEE